MQIRTKDDMFLRRDLQCVSGSTKKTGYSGPNYIKLFLWKNIHYSSTESVF